MTDPNLPSLLADINLPEKAAKRSAKPTAGQQLAQLRAWSNRTPRRRKTLRIGSWTALAAAVGIGGWFTYLQLRPPPDYKTDEMDVLFDYTLLEDDFNKLPVQQRLALMKDLVTRLKGMTEDDALGIAIVAASIGGGMREQLEKNVSNLMLDAWDEYAQEYTEVPADQKAAALDDILVKIARMAEDLTGEPSGKSDQELLDEAREQAARDQKQFSDPERRPSSGQMSRLMTVLNDDIGKHSTPGQRVRGQVLMRDLTRNLRGQDIHTGKPKPR